MLTVVFLISLGNPSKDGQRFVDAVVSISAPYWSVRLSNFENAVQTPFECGLRTTNDARFCQTVMSGTIYFEYFELS